MSTGKQNGTSFHTHVEPEFFIIFKGSYTISSGERDNEANSILLNRFDFIANPEYCFRTFQSQDDDSCLFAGIPAYVAKQFFWHPNVIQDAKGRGLVLLENNTLIDTTKGYEVPSNMKEMPLMSAEELEKHKILTTAELEGCTFRYNKAKWRHFFDGLEVIYALGPNDAKYTFELRKKINLNAYIFKLFNRKEIVLKNSHSAALIMFEGEVNITLHLEDGAHTIWVKPGDTLAIPQGVTYDLNLMTNEAQYYLLIANDYSEVLLV